MDIFEINNTFAERFKAKRKEKGYTQQTFANAIGLSDYKTIGAWEKGKIPQQTEQLIMTAELLECDIDYLLGFQEETTKELTDVCEATGLSADAVKRLQDNKTLAYIVDYFIRRNESEEIGILTNSVISEGIVSSHRNKSSEYVEFKKIRQNRKHPEYKKILHKTWSGKWTYEDYLDKLDIDDFGMWVESCFTDKVPDGVDNQIEYEQFKYGVFEKALDAEKHMRYAKHDIYDLFKTIFSRYIEKLIEIEEESETK